MSSLPSLMKLRRPVANDLRAQGSSVITPAQGEKDEEKTRGGKDRRENC